jgi:metallo-beta-lactamase class B
MKIFKLYSAVALLCLLVFPFQASAQRLSAATDGQRPANANPGSQEFVGMIKLFDNLHYVGTNFVGALLLETSDGLILIDSIYQDFTAQALQAITDAGFDPGEIRYVLVSHGHQDHFGGAMEVKAVSGATIGMLAEDWAMSGLDTDMVIEDGDTLELGDNTLLFYQTPGHTQGVMSIVFSVRDGDNSHRAFLLGGHNVTSNRVEDFELFIPAVERMQGLLNNVEVNLTTHPWASLIFQRAEQLAQRQTGESHPFVDAEDFAAFLTERIENARRRLAVARAGE